MRSACEHDFHMTSHLQIKNVDTKLHKKLKIRAVEHGMSLSDYLRKELEKIAARPTPAEVYAKLRALPPVIPKSSIVDLIREDRDNR
jgi:antitoxin FitA